MLKEKQWADKIIGRAEDQTHRYFNIIVNFKEIVQCPKTAVGRSNQC